MVMEGMSPCWHSQLVAYFENDRFAELTAFVGEERREHEVFPADDQILNALRMAPFGNVRVVILGQDPYHDDGQAHGLAFSVPQGVKQPPSLRNIFRELQDDLGIAPPSHGCLNAWARQGVLLLNTVLTVRAHEPNSHRGRGWEEFTTHVIELVNERPHVAFLLWGKPAQEKASLIDSRHLVIQSAHPSPLSARRGFFGSRPFSKINAFLERTGQSVIDWKLE